MLAIIQLGHLSISTYPTILIIGTLGMFLCCIKRRALFGMSLWQCGAFTALLTAVGVLGAMLLFALENSSWGGVSFYGSVYLIPLLMPLIGLFFRLKPYQSMDICGPCVAIMIGCLRINCFLSGCCGGWNVCVKDLCFALPTQAIDSIADFAILIWLLHMEVQGKMRGLLYPLFMIAYSAMRFGVEFLRDTPKNVYGMSNGQWYALAAIVFGSFWIFTSGSQKRKS